MEHYEHNEHKDIESILQEHYEDEIEGACDYAKLAEKYPEYAKDFWALGREEVTHADHFRTLLRHHGHEFSDEHEGKWHRVLKKYGFER